ncbi:GH92 family glycosyl hydrolase [Parafilimonas sp.]|uniref:GH92 family glycosyl hydrolase n=1 Tax=Parafilimonas sp. TaxID=1969739 RepID=UPI0039E23891
MKYTPKQILNIIAAAGRHKFKLALLVCILFNNALPAQHLIQYVQPLAGTAPSTTVSALKHSEAGSEKNANTIPAVGLPFGMAQWTAQTRTGETKCMPPYIYTDSLFTGFRGTHWINGSCMQDYGSFTMMPVVGKLSTNPNEYAVAFLHQQEETTPAYYKIATEKFAAEITSTLRCGLMRFTANSDDSLYLLVMPNSDYGKGFIKVDAGKNVIYGYSPVHRIYQNWGQPAGFNGWFYIKIERPFSVKGTFSQAEIFYKDSIKDGKNIGAFAGFTLKKGEQIIVKTGTSFSSLKGAETNLEKETGDKSFDAVMKEAVQAWNGALSAIAISAKNEKDKKIFYTAMYHAMQQPRLYNDVDGAYPKFNSRYELMNSDSRNYYDDFSMWDIYRAQLPLLELLDPERAGDFVQSLIWKGQQGGWLPIFPCWNSYTAAMTGDHSAAFIASAYTKNIRNYDAPEAYRLMRQNAFTVADEKDYADGKGRRALASYLKYGYIPIEDSVPLAFHKKEQVSRTLEYAYDDYTLSVMAKALGKKDDYAALYKRAFNYKNVFDPNHKLVNGRYADGSWYKGFNADVRPFFITEGTPRQYTFYVPQDVPGLAGLMGGRKALENALDSLFLKGEYWHGNEPGHQIPFMYNYTASPWKTQKAVRQILNDEYSDGPGGLSGNDDAGQMSAWYVFAAIGFYPLDPVSGNYLMCSPLFDSVAIRLPGNKMFKIICHKANDAALYISRAELNGTGYTNNYLQHKDIINGGELHIWLQSKPSGWGNEINAQPKGLSSK